LNKRINGNPRKIKRISAIASTISQKNGHTSAKMRTIKALKISWFDGKCNSLHSRPVNQYSIDMQTL